VRTARRVILTDREHGLAVGQAQRCLGTWRSTRRWRRRARHRGCQRPERL